MRFFDDPATDRRFNRMQWRMLYAGTSIGFISLFSYVGVAVSGKVCGSLAQSSGGWRMPVLVIAAVAGVGAALFLLLWNVRANSYDSEK